MFKSLIIKKEIGGVDFYVIGLKLHPMLLLRGLHIRMRGIFD